MMASAPVRVFVVVNTANADARPVARPVVEALIESGAHISGVTEDIEALDMTSTAGSNYSSDLAADPPGAGWGPMWSWSWRRRNYPAGRRTRGTWNTIAGVNLGHVGFLAEAEPEDVTFVVESLIKRRWSVEERTRLNVSVLRDGTRVGGTWAVNEVSLEKGTRERMINVLVEVDGRPLSRWGCDGVVCATPTGSTAYAFSAGGPVVWPEVAALLVVPLSAHALFARPLVVSPSSSIASISSRSRRPSVGRWTPDHRCSSGDGLVSPPMSNRCASPAWHQPVHRSSGGEVRSCRSTVGVGVSAREQ